MITLLESMLAPLNREALQTLLLNLARSRPEWGAEIEKEIAKLPPSPTPPFVLAGVGALAVAPVPLAPTVIRKQVRNALKAALSSENINSWDDDDSDRIMELESGITPLIEIADASIEAGDGRAAFPTLEAITDELIGEWERVEDVISEASELFEDLGRAWAEALLTVELTPEERQDWIDRLETWQEAGDTCGADRGLAVAVEAAKQGWDYPPLVRVLQGEITDKGAWEDEPEDCADELAVARLNVLERQGRWQEAAYLAEAEGQYERHMALLVRLGRAEEAVEIALTLLSTAASALTLAKVLIENNEINRALRIGEHGLSLQGPISPLAIWLRDTALAVEEKALAIRAAMAALREAPNLIDYTRLQEIADEQWPPLREEILTRLRATRSFDAANHVDIFLHEGMREEALHAVHDSWNYDLVARVVETLTPELPLQVIPICAHQAARIMDAGKADRYHYAAQWVERARNAYRAAGQEEQWQAYKAGLLATHQRKYKLVPMLRPL